MASHRVGERSKYEAHPDQPHSTSRAFGKRVTEERSTELIARNAMHSSLSFLKNYCFVRAIFAMLPTLFAAFASFY